MRVAIRRTPIESLNRLRRTRRNLRHLGVLIEPAQFNPNRLVLKLLSHGPWSTLQGTDSSRRHHRVQLIALLLNARLDGPARRVHAPSNVSGNLGVGPIHDAGK